MTLAPTTFCPVGSTDEGEECRTSFPDTFNGGCNAFRDFTNIAFGESVCGTVSNWVENRVRPVRILLLRDSDNYYFKVSEDTTVSVRVTTDFDAFLILDQLGDGASCPSAFVANTTTDIGDNTFVISKNLTAGDYTILVTSQSIGDSSLFCPTPGNYTLTLTDETIP